MKTYQEFITELNKFEAAMKAGKVGIKALKKVFADPKTGAFKINTTRVTNPLANAMFKKKGYQVKQFITGKGGLTRTLNPFLGKGKGLRSGPTPLARQTPRLLKQGAKKLLKFALTRRL